MCTIKYVTGPNGFAPTKGHKLDAGWDLYATGDEEIMPLNQIGHDLQLHLDIPEGWCGIIMDRSSLAAKGLHVTGGVVDSGYNGSIRVLLRNFASEPFAIRRGDRIAQIVFFPHHALPLEPTSRIEMKDERGNGGFGSTGK